MEMESFYKTFFKESASLETQEGKLELKVGRSASFFCGFLSINDPAVNHQKVKKVTRVALQPSLNHVKFNIPIHNSQLKTNWLLGFAEWPCFQIKDCNEVVNFSRATKGTCFYVSIS